MSQVNKAAIKLIHADGFFPKGDEKSLLNAIKDLRYVQTSYGYEVPDVNLIFKDIDTVFSKMLGENIQLDKKRSGIFRKPINNIIHVEDFVSTNEWCFIVALEPTTFNIFHHTSDSRFVDPVVDHETALTGHNFNYRNLFEWKLVTNIYLTANQGVFFRPWCFHSLENGIIQYYRLLPEEEQDV